MQRDNLSLLCQFRASLASVTGIACDTALHYLATCSFDGAIRVWAMPADDTNLNNTINVNNNNNNSMQRKAYSLVWHMQYTQPLTCIAFCHVPPALYAGTDSGAILLTLLPRDVCCFFFIFFFNIS